MNKRKLSVKRLLIITSIIVGLFLLWGVGYAMSSFGILTFPQKTDLSRTKEILVN